MIAIYMVACHLTANVISKKTHSNLEKIHSELEKSHSKLEKTHNNLETTHSKLGKKLRTLN